MTRKEWTSRFRPNSAPSSQRAAAQLETLESRELFASITYVSGSLVLVGDPTTPNSLYVSQKSDTHVIAYASGVARKISLSNLASIKLAGGADDDKLFVDPNLKVKSYFWGGAGKDRISGGGGNDTVVSGGGNDIIYTYSGADKVSGEAGNDYINTGTGNDYADGGSGTNTIVNAEVSLNPATNVGAVKSGGVTPSSSGTGFPKAVIKAISTTIAAGQSFHADAMSSSLTTGTPLTTRYQWDFGDAKSKYNNLEGFNASHVYENPGTYTVKLTVTNAAWKFSTTTVKVNVTAANRRQIFVSSAGSDSNNGSATKPIKNWSKAIALLGDNTEIFFRRGDTFSITKGMQIYRKNVVLNSYGSGNLPVLKWDGDLDYSSMIWVGKVSRDIKVANITFDSKYGGNGSNGMPQAISGCGAGMTVQGCTFLNVGTAINAQSMPNGLLAQDNSSPTTNGLRSYFCWAAGKNLVFLGNYVANSAHEHDIRIAGADNILVAFNNLSNPKSQYSGDVVTKGTITIHKGSYAYIANNKLSAGKLTVGPLGEGDGLSHKADRFNYAVFENNIIDSPTIIEHGAQHVMMRNNVFKSENYAAIEIEPYNSQYGRGVVDVKIVNNTGVTSGEDGEFLKVDGKVSGIDLVNNLYLAPKLKFGLNGSMGVFVQDSSLSSFNTISNNVWPHPSNGDAYAQGGVNYIYTYWSNQNGWKTPGEWDAYAQVSSDSYEDPSFSSAYQPSASSKSASSAKSYGGVFTDMTGAIRPAAGWAAGAMES